TGGVTSWLPRQILTGDSGGGADGSGRLRKVRRKLWRTCGAAVVGGLAESLERKERKEMMRWFCAGVVERTTEYNGGGSSAGHSLGV
ncbi:hypothetical protein HAX54_041067, partial [Datura stramonium]|nr:hypothetical protein [Datura stramonium]